MKPRPTVRSEREGSDLRAHFNNFPEEKIERHSL